LTNATLTLLALAVRGTDRTGKLAAAVKAAAPKRHSYNWYGLDGGTHFGRFGGYAAWQYFMFGVADSDQIADYPGASLYRPDNGQIVNTGKTDNHVNDLLSAALAAKAVEIIEGQPLNQSWVWVREDKFGVFDQYLGYLKCLYVLGMVGHINFLMPEGAVSQSNYDYGVPVDPDDPPTWLRQVEQFARVYAVFTHLEPFIREGELVAGPHRHIYWEQRHMKQRLPGYVLDNPHELFRDTGGSFGNPRPGNVRVVARQMPGGDLLLCVWAADGQPREVPVTMPDGTTVTLQATPRGTLYTGPAGKLEPRRSSEPGLESRE
jgi:hypothetical protein